MENSFKSVPKAVGIMNKKFNENSPPEKKWKKTVNCNKEGKKCKTTYSDFNN
jgi:hypothetical protein